MSTRLTESHARRVSEAAATMPSFTAATTWDPCRPEVLLERLRATTGVVDAAWRDGAVVVAEAPRLAVALPGPVLPTLSHPSHYEALRGRDPFSFTAAELAGATFTVWGLELDVDWLTPPLLPRQGAGLGVGFAGLTLACDARAITPEGAAALLTAATGRSGSGRRPS